MHSKFETRRGNLVWKDLSPNDCFAEPIKPRYSAPISFLSYKTFLVVLAVLFISGLGLETANADVLLNNRNGSPNCACSYNAVGTAA